MLRAWSAGTAGSFAPWRDEALMELASFDSRKSRVAEVRLSGGLSVGETADAPRISSVTVDREWQVARARLYTRLTEAPRA